MKLLLISDQESAYFWDHFRPGVLSDYDLILSAGDLKAEYLEFLVTMARCPLVYVPGNHDGRFQTHPPEGCDCADDDVITVKGLRILGLGGCPMYNKGPYQYTETQMRRRIQRLRWKIARAGGVDILLTHAPAAGWGDLSDPAHRGFQAFLPLLDETRPRFMVHGHVHLNYSARIQRTLQRGETVIINACGHYTLDIPDGE